MGKEDCDILRPLSDFDLEILLDLYRANFPKTIFHYYTIYQQIKWNKQLKLVESNKGLDKIFYTHRNGDLKKNGTFVSIVTDDQIVSVSFYTIEEDLHELEECLEKTKKINWNLGPMFTGVHMDLANFVDKFSKLKGVSYEYQRTCICFRLYREQAEKLDYIIPSGYELRTLTNENALQIHSVWPNNKEGSFQFISGLLKLNKSLGIFKIIDNKLVSWIIQNEFSGVGVLQTLDEEQGKGFGGILIKALCKLIAQDEQMEITAFIVENNIKSQKLFKKIGFEISQYTKWLRYKKN